MSYIYINENNSRRSKSWARQIIHLLSNLYICTEAENKHLSRNTWQLPTWFDLFVSQKWRQCLVIRAKVKLIKKWIKVRNNTKLNKTFCLGYSKRNKQTKQLYSFYASTGLDLDRRCCAYLMSTSAPGTVAVDKMMYMHQIKFKSQTKLVVPQLSHKWCALCLLSILRQRDNSSALFAACPDRTSSLQKQ